MPSIATYSLDDVYKQFKGGLRDVHRAATALRAQSPVPFLALAEHMQRLKDLIGYCEDRLSRFPDAIGKYAQDQEGMPDLDVVREWQGTRAAVELALDVMAALAKGGSTFAVDETAKTITEPRYGKGAVAALDAALDTVIASITVP